MCTRLLSIHRENLILFYIGCFCDGHDLFLLIKVMETNGNWRPTKNAKYGVGTFFLCMSIKLSPLVTIL
jgi:hypothetical protein